MLQVGDSFEVDFGIGSHLHVIAAEASSEANSLVFIVYLSSENGPYKDHTTIIQPGEHPFVTRESWVRHQNIRICQRDSIDTSKNRSFPWTGNRRIIS